VRRSRAPFVVVGLVVLVTFALSVWRLGVAKYGEASTVAAVAVSDGIVLQQRATSAAGRGPMAQDRLVSINGRTGREQARATILRGELLGSRGEDAVYAIGQTYVLYNGRSLASKPAGQLAPLAPITRFGALVDLGDALLLLDTLPQNGVARVSRLHKESRSTEWSMALPWKGHDTKLVAVFSQIIVVVDADGAAGLDRSSGDVQWLY
jgi:hypothetical protein